MAQQEGTLMDKTKATQVFWKNAEHAEAHLVKYHTCEANDWTHRVAARMVAEQVCVWHAAWEDALEGYETGRIATVTCSYCGGRADVRIGFHHMCKAYSEHGRETPRLDIGPGPCGCFNCSLSDGGE